MTLPIVIDHGRRRILHFNVTAHPTARWVMQHDSIRACQPSGFLRSCQTAMSPWQNGAAERFVGSVRRELLDHVVILDEDHVRRLLREYIDYYNCERVHTATGDTPEGREVEHRPSDRAKVVNLPRVGGVQHRYVWSEAA